MSKPDEGPFYVGYLATPASLKPFLAWLGTALLIGALALGYTVAATQDDPGDGAFRFDLGRQTVTGVLVGGGYPVLRITSGNERLPAGHTLMLSGQGKNGVQGRAAPLAGQLVTVEGVLLTRGDLDMLQLRGGEDGLRAAEGTVPTLSPPEPLGRWRVTGELCDGKCAAGAMRPGLGLSHKACANLCIVGGVPMVMATTAPLEGARFLLVTGPDGGAAPQALLDRTAELVSLEGQVSRIDDLLVLHADPDTLGPP
ncbi:MAG: hypothetical protein AAFS07_15990 [Pseudomonadota bacterium]